ncbi:MAG: DUF4397 domain-containing protein [Chitinophagaceae bacterium]|nr:DUF4397 domain-containing protein [Chitinophagaceae bacterium]
MRKITTNSILLIALNLFWLLSGSCKKDKIDYNAPVEEKPDTPASSVSGPSQAANFKIRVVNVMERTVEQLQWTDPNDPNNAWSSPLENLLGAATLAYADGTPVSDETSNIQAGDSSAYIELPYGTYQFRVLTEDGRQIPAMGSGPLDPATSRMPVFNSPATASGITYAPVITCQPGGAYSIEVAPNPFIYFVPPPGEYFGNTQNQFSIKKDNPEVPNTQFGRVQAVNALPDQQKISFRVNGEIFDEELSYGTASGYKILKAGSYTIEALDADGNVLATTGSEISGGQNHSVWLWQDKDGKPQLLPVFNDLSSTYYYHQNDEYGAENRTADNLPAGIRFLNLCPDEPYISFTVDDGQDARESAVAWNGNYEKPGDDALYNLQPGLPATRFPYTRWITNHNSVFKFMAYRSKPGITPGTWVSDIPGLSTYYFVANPNLYTDVVRSVPVIEPGIYTVTLTGRTGNAANGLNNARMIIIKHNK